MICWPSEFIKIAVLEKFQCCIVPLMFERKPYQANELFSEPGEIRVTRVKSKTDSIKLIIRHMANKPIIIMRPAECSLP